MEGIAEQRPGWAVIWKAQLKKKLGIHFDLEGLAKQSIVSTVCAKAQPSK